MPVTQAKYRLTAKVSLLGDPAVGKTSIIRRYLRMGFSKDYLATIGVDIYTKATDIEFPQLGKVHVAWQIWDIAGHKRWQDIRTVFYRGSQGVIFVFDVSRRETYENVMNWAREFLKHAGVPRPAVLVANKVDLREKVPNCVTTEEGKELSARLEKLFGFRIPYIEASALEGLNIDEIFVAIAHRILEGLLKRG